ncbi:MAG TPA: MarR family transcriptional regulator [Jatrophihabitantaceae bacterium]
MISDRSSVLLGLQRATHATTHALAAHVADLGLTPAEINALANLAGSRPRTVSELGQLIGSPPTTLTSVLDRLERRGHVARNPHPSDRRALVVELTPSGRRAAASIRRAIGRLETHLLGRLDAASIDGLRAGLDALTGATP